MASNICTNIQMLIRDKTDITFVEVFLHCNVLVRLKLFFTFCNNVQKASQSKGCRWDQTLCFMTSFLQFLGMNLMKFLPCCLFLPFYYMQNQTVPNIWNLYFWTKFQLWNLLNPMLRNVIIDFRFHKIIFDVFYKIPSYFQSDIWEYAWITYS